MFYFFYPRAHKQNFGEFVINLKVLGSPQPYQLIMTHPNSPFSYSIPILFPYILYTLLFYFIFYYNIYQKYVKFLEDTQNSFTASQLNVFERYHIKL